MDVPITRPSMVSYAEDLDFHELLEKLVADEHNGFVRITVKEYEGYIIFKDGKQVAAEYHKYSKSEAVENILSAVKDEGTLIEVFDLKSSHMDYIMDLNKPYAIESDHDVTIVLEKLKNEGKQESLVVEKLEKPKTTDSREPEKTSEVEIAEVETSKSEVQTPDVEPEAEVETPPLEPVSTPEPESELELEPEPVPEPEVVDETPEERVNYKDKLESLKNNVESESRQEVEEEVEEVEEAPLDRSKLLAKYGIREMDEEDVDQLLDTYKGGSLSHEDVEKIELNLMNKIKKSIFGIPKIKGAEVMVFLQSSAELSGYINIIIEYGGKSLISRFMGESQDVENLRRQVINIAQIEIKKSFRKYPQVVEKFNINVEIS